jgi:lycopene beta-cyclase
MYKQWWGRFKIQQQTSGRLRAKIMLRRACVCSFVLLRAALGFVVSPAGLSRSAGSPALHAAAGVHAGLGIDHRAPVRGWAVPLMSAQLQVAPEAAAGSAVNLYDVAVVGAGPAGLALSAHLGERGLRVVTIDPTINKEAWIPNYGVWLDEIEPLGLRDCLMTQWPVATVLMGGPSGDEKITLNRPYARMDRKKFKEHMRKRCEESGVRLEAAPAKDATHDAAGTTLVIGEGDAATSVRCKLLVDCSGFGKAYVKFDEGREPGWQIP